MSLDFQAKVHNYFNTPSLQPRWVNDQPAWYKIAHKTHLVGKILVGMGVLLAAVAIGGPIIFTGNPLFNPTLAIVLGVVGGAGCLTALGVGIYMILRKEFWDDPAFKMEKRKEIIECLISEGYNAAATKYRKVDANPSQEWGWDRHELISNKTIQSIIIEEHFNKAGSSEVREILNHIEGDRANSIELLIEHGIIEAEYMTRFYVQEIQDHKEMTFSDFIKRHGWQIFEDRRVSCDIVIDKHSNRPEQSSLLYPDLFVNQSAQSNKQTFREYCLEELSTINTLSEICRTFTKEGFWKLFQYNLITVEDIRSKGLSEIATLQCFTDVYQRFSQIDFWRLLDKGILVPQDVRPHFENQLKEQPSFHEIMTTFGGCIDIWTLMDRKIAKTTDFQEFVVAAFETNRFDSMIQKYGWKLFNYNLVVSSDPYVSWRFHEFLSNVQFSLLFSSYYDHARNHGLFNALHPDTFHLINRLHSDLDRAYKIYHSSIDRANSSYNFAIDSARNRRDHTINLARSHEENLKKAYDREPAEFISESYTVVCSIRQCNNHKCTESGHRRIREIHRLENPRKRVLYHEWQKAIVQTETEVSYQQRELRNTEIHQEELRQTTIRAAENLLKCEKSHVEDNWASNRPLVPPKPYLPI